MRNSVPNNAEIQSEGDPVRRAILGAIQRMVSGHPLRVPPGASTVRHLATEAGVGRHHLYQSHGDLRERFRFLIADDTGVDVDTAREQAGRARAELSRVKDLQRRTYEDMRMWKATCEVLQRAINVLQEELRQEQLKSARLRRRLSAAPSAGAVVVPIRPR